MTDNRYPGQRWKSIVELFLHARLLWDMFYSLKLSLFECCASIPPTLIHQKSNDLKWPEKAILVGPEKEKYLIFLLCSVQNFPLKKKKKKYFFFFSSFFLYIFYFYFFYFFSLLLIFFLFFF